MELGFQLSFLLGTSTVSLSSFDNDEEPLVGAIYAWQETFIDNFQVRHDQDLWQVAEQKVKIENDLLSVGAYFTGFTLDDSPVPLSQIVDSTWRGAQHIYQLDISKVIFDLDSNLDRDGKLPSPDFCKYQCAYEWLRLCAKPLPIPIRVAILSDIDSSLNIARETIDFINACGLSDITLVPDQHNKNRNSSDRFTEEHYRMSLPVWDSIPISWLLSALVRIYLPKTKEKLTISIKM